MACLLCRNKKALRFIEGFFCEYFFSPANNLKEEVHMEEVHMEEVHMEEAHMLEEE